MSKKGKMSHNRSGQVLTRLHIMSGSRLPSLMAIAKKRADARMRRLRVNGRIAKFLVKKESLPVLLHSNDWIHASEPECEGDAKASSAGNGVVGTAAVICEAKAEEKRRRGHVPTKKVAASALRKAKRAMGK